jgi:hypothetical protein
MKGYTKQKLTFTKIELIQQLQNWNCNLTDLFDEDKIDIGIKALAFNKLGIDFLFNSDQEFKKISDRLHIEINYFFCNGNPDSELINFDYCEVQIEVFPEENYLIRAAIEN